jgi:hypothetical protein
MGFKYTSGMEMSSIIVVNQPLSQTFRTGVLNLQAAFSLCIQHTFFIILYPSENEKKVSA